MKLEFEIDADGYFKASGSFREKLNERNFSSSGKIALDDDEDELFNKLRVFVRNLESYCPAEYYYHSNSPGK